MVQEKYLRAYILISVVSGLRKTDKLDSVGYFKKTKKRTGRNEEVVVELEGLGGEVRNKYGQNTLYGILKELTRIFL